MTNSELTDDQVAAAERAVIETGLARHAGVERGVSLVDFTALADAFNNACRHLSYLRAARNAR